MLRVLDLDGGTVESMPAAAPDLRGVAWSPDGRFLVTAGHGDSVAIIDFQRRKAQWYATGHAPSAHDGLDFSPDGRWVSFATSAGPFREQSLAIYALEISSGRVVELFHGVGKYVDQRRWLRDSRGILFAEAADSIDFPGATHRVTVMRSFLNGRRDTLSHFESACPRTVPVSDSTLLIKLRVSSNPSIVSIGCADELSLVNSATLKPVMSFPGWIHTISRVAVSADGNTMTFRVAGDSLPFVYDNMVIADVRSHSATRCPLTYVAAQGWRGQMIRSDRRELIALSDDSLDTVGVNVTDLACGAPRLIRRVALRGVERANHFDLSSDGRYLAFVEVEGR